MKNNSGERAWNAVCIYCNIWLSSWNCIGSITQAGTGFQRERGILQMAAYWNHCQKERRLYQAHIESNVQLRISLRLFFHAVTSVLIFPACCSTWLMHFSQSNISEGLRRVLTKTVTAAEWWWGGKDRLNKPREVMADFWLGKSRRPWWPACLLCCSCPSPWKYLHFLDIFGKVLKNHCKRADTV